MKRLCGAKNRSGGFCRQPAMPDRTRCRFHGGKAGRPRGIPDHPNTLAAKVAGRARWVEKMRALKAQGLITRFPNGIRRKDQPRLSSDKKIRKAQLILEVYFVMQEK